MKTFHSLRNIIDESNYLFLPLLPFSFRIFMHPLGHNNITITTHSDVKKILMYNTNDQISDSLFSFLYRRAPVAQSVAMRAVNPGVVSLNPNILSDVWQKSLWQATFVFHQWANSLCGKAASSLERMLCGVLVWENQETIIRRWTGRDMTEKLLTTTFNPNQSIIRSSIK